jgi:iron complex outermembrane recepter protein
MINSDGVEICVRRPGDASTDIIYKVNTDGTFIRCHPINLLAPPGQIPASQLRSVIYTGLANGFSNQRSALATAHGQLAALPNHGEVALAVGASYRDERGGQNPEPEARTRDTTDTVIYEATDGRFHAFEGYADLSVVALRDTPLVRRLELDLAARAFHYNRFGDGVTYKAGGVLRTVGGLGVRGTFTTAFRAPSISEIFTGRTERNPTAEDPCDSQPPSAGGGTRQLDAMTAAACAAQGVPAGTKFTTSQQVAVFGGNPDLRPETAHTATVGLVVEPPPLPGLTLLADYWHVRIDDAIQSLGVQTIFANCYARGLGAFCDQIHRDPDSHRITAVDQALQNAGTTSTSGLDLGATYDVTLAGLGRLHAALDTQYLFAYDLETAGQVIHGRGFYDLGVYPRYKANLATTWTHPSGALGGLLVRVGTYKECAANDCNSAANLAVASRDVDRYVKLDVFGGYDVATRAGKWNVQVGVNNLIDATPPTVYNATAASADASAYDFVGRVVYLRLTQRM